MERFDIIKITEHEFAVATVVLDKKLNKKVRLVIVYGPAHDENKEQFLIELSNICAQSDLPLLLGGDFNIIRYSGGKIKISIQIDLLICLIVLSILMG
jgi:hypothetical protein